MRNRSLQIVVFARVWSLLSGLLLVAIASIVFTPTQQGYFYTFLSLAASQYFFDLGVGFVLANIAGRHTPNDIEGRAFSLEELDKMRSIVRFALKWSLLASIALILILGVIGFNLFSNVIDHNHELKYIWLAYILFVAYTMSFHLFLRMFEGVGFVVEAALTRSIQSFVNIICLYLFASNQLGIVSMVYAVIISLIVATVFFAASSTKIRSTFSFQRSDTKRINWKKDIYPFQSKVAISWIAGYVIFQSQIPILYHLSGPIQAGKFGLIVQVFQALNTSVNIFLTFNVRPWTRFSSIGNYSELHKSFKKTTLITLGLMAIGSGLVLMASWVLIFLNFEVSTRIPEFKVLLIYAVAACFNQIFFCLGYYFRAQEKEPLWIFSVFAAIAILATPLFLRENFNITAAVLSFFISSVFILGIFSTLYSLRLIRALPNG